MQYITPTMLQQLTGQQNWEAISCSDLQQLREQQPSNAFFTLLLVKKLQETKENNALLHSIQPKLSLFSHNLFWLQHQLQSPWVTAGSAPNVAVATSEAEPFVEQEETNAALALLLENQKKVFEQEVQPDAEIPLEIKPLHSINFFESQGINAAPSTENARLLQKRVHTFTDWLKQMKKMPVTNIDLGTSAEEEAKVSNQAQASNSLNDVVTEAMAEVLEKQGLISRAISIYQKLSLQDSDKTVYFAQKIKLLKEKL